MHRAQKLPTRLLALAATLCALALLAMPATADAKRGKKVWIVKGGGYGHGVGMSQYGAFGFAKRGTGYKAILKHYYRGTAIGTTANRTVRVLLRPYQPTVRFKGATAACGVGLVEKNPYTARRKGGKVLLFNKGGSKLANCGGLLSATGGATVVLLGKGTYRGALEVRPSSVPGRLNAINAVGLEDYLRGIIAEESPASWPINALRAQAVAARSYALSTNKNGIGFDHYDDTRSQVYGGIASETASTNRAVAETALQVVLYQGQIAQTYFFSTSGGHTENNEWSSLGFGGTPIPYLRGVPDPYDNASPYHRWKRKFSLRSMQARLGDLVRGKLKRIVILKRGASPRIRKARLVGTRGTTKVIGPTLQYRLGLPDTWAKFKKR